MDATADHESSPEPEEVDAILLREATMLVIEGRRDAKSSNLEQVKETEEHKNGSKEKEFVGDKRTKTVEYLGNSETFFFYNSASPLSRHFSEVKAI